MTTQVQKVTVEAIDRGKALGGKGWGVFVYATRDGNNLRTCIETSGIKASMMDRAQKHAKSLRAPFVDMSA